jgi:dipeptidyl aminopeptidase/acylaminoacyl peptidase
MNNSQPAHLVLDYRPSQWTGWEWGKTIGGHHAGKGIIDIYGGVKWGWQLQPG